MSRMDKYEDKDIVVSRTIKNQDMYKDVYLNSTLIDLDMKKEEKKEPEEEVVPTITYVQKNYSVTDYLSKAHEKRVNDNALRSLDNTDCEVERVKEKKDEISRLISDIEQKERNEDFFKELMPDEENNTLIMEPVSDKLEEALDENLIYEYAYSSETKVIEDDDFKDIEKDVVVKNKKKSNKLPLIFFLVTLFILILVIVFVVIK